MLLIPAILHIVKPTIYSIDTKGKATIKITLLAIDDRIQPSATTTTKSYRTLHEDHIILVSPKKKQQRQYNMESIVGPVSELRHWNAILPLRIGLKQPKYHVPFRIPSLITLLPQSPSPDILRKYILIDSPGTIDREDGIWWSSNDNYGVFTIDIPTQKGWTHQSKSCVDFLSSKLFDFYIETYHLPPTRSFYLPSTRLPMIDSRDYICLSKESLETHTSIPIICYNIAQPSICKSHIHKDNEVIFATTDDDPSKFPSWYHQSPLANLSVADCNITMNQSWASRIPTNPYIMYRPHPSCPDSTYAPITSPIRNMGDLWNQCVLHDYLTRSKIQTCKQIEHMRLQCIQDLEKSKFLSIHITNLKLVHTLFETRKDTEPIFEGNVSYVAEKYGIVESKQHTFWIPFKELQGAKVGDRITVKCRLHRNPDPFRMIQVVNTKTES